MCIRDRILTGQKEDRSINKLQWTRWANSCGRIRKHVHIHIQALFGVLKESDEDDFMADNIQLNSGPWWIRVEIKLLLYLLMMFPVQTLQKYISLPTHQ